MHQLIAFTGISTVTPCTTSLSQNIIAAHSAHDSYLTVRTFDMLLYILKQRATGDYLFDLALSSLLRHSRVVVSISLPLSFEF